jgi:hypothetical protein
MEHATVPCARIFWLGTPGILKDPALTHERASDTSDRKYQRQDNRHFRKYIYIGYL